ncbi:hypothetical protein GCM10009677_00940 [Sphaerisporangium rubeum]|uniref:Nucleoside 2-deoxyribosyltransferase n=1 Tax=Sphaerisporangium rubeum TaxID=321317 RepID=A0A7X0IIM3_9ACTN|nr:DUF4062 domain-containing protein [Sphaerisporangium rubeum]MBB6475344.1 nucleoside 2-deoxyribosyltransferase [Sphaerisporangium rubeum]
MSFDARVFQILVASPGDVQPEREIVAEIIHEWNYLNSRDRRIVLIPLRWETHSSPEMGTRPQAVINRQVVDQCDLAVGVFWTRLGTETSEAESGTAEEIERVGAQGKPVMLYFSRAATELDKVDLNEYARLKSFKEKTYPHGLVEHYNTLSEFREKFSKQLSISIRDVIAMDSTRRPGNTAGGDPITLGILVADQSTSEISGLPARLHFTRTVCRDEDKIPDLVAKTLNDSPDENEADPQPSTHDDLADVDSTNPDSLTVARDWLRIGRTARRTQGYNKDYLRQLVDYHCNEEAYRPIRFAVTAPSTSGVKDLFLELRLSLSSGGADIVNRLPFTRPFAVGDFNMGEFFIGSDAPRKSSLSLRSTKEKSEWLIEIEATAIQTQRTFVIPDRLYLRVDSDCAFSIEGTVYSSDAPPYSLHTQLEIGLTKSVMSYIDILKIAKRAVRDENLGIDIVSGEIHGLQQ